MYVIIRTMKIEKGYLDKYMKNFKKESPLTKFDGFVKKELFISSKEKEFDIVSTHVFFKDKKAFYKWQGSSIHIELHKQKKDNPTPKPDELIEMTKESFELVDTVIYE